MYRISGNENTEHPLPLIIGKRNGNYRMGRSELSGVISSELHTTCQIYMYEQSSILWNLGFPRFVQPFYILVPSCQAFAISDTESLFSGMAFVAPFEIY